MECAAGFAGCRSSRTNAFYSEEEFSIAANRSGLFLFDGGKPMPISRELQSTGVNGSIWEKINWTAGKTLWALWLDQSAEEEETHDSLLRAVLARLGAASAMVHGLAKGAKMGHPDVRKERERLRSG